MYRLGSEKAKIRFIPKFTLPGSYDDNTREVKFTDEEFERLESEVLRTSNFPLLVFIRAARNLGWRSGELRKMKVNQFEVADSVATLPRTGSKNKKARRIRLTKSMAAMFRALADGKSPDDLLFVIPDFYERWQQACIAAGLGELRCRRCGRATMPNTQKAKLPKVRGLCKARWCPTCAEPKGNREIMYEGRIPHDLRRTAATDMSNALVPDRVICDTVGFSVAMLKRYHIGDEEQTGRGQTQLEAWRKARAEERAAALTASKLSTTYEQPAPKAVQNAVPEKLVN
jgi:integrase